MLRNLLAALPSLCVPTNAKASHLGLVEDIMGTRPSETAIYHKVK